MDITKAMGIAEWHAKVLKEHRDAMIVAAFGDVIEDTPITSGTLVNSWRTSIGYPIIQQAVDPVPNADAPLAELQAVVKSSNTEQDIYMANGARHAYGVEFFSWAYLQRPEGMVRKNLVQWGNEQIQFLTEGPK